MKKNAGNWQQDEDSRGESPEAVCHASRHRNFDLHRTKSAASDLADRVTSRLTAHDIANPGPPPDGGLQAWTQVCCAWIAILNTWGFVNSFGAFQTYYTAVLPQSPSTISWIGSCQSCLLFFLSTFSGRALDAGLFRPTVVIGIFFQLTGIFTMSFAKNYWQLLLTQGVCTGIGGGIFFCPVMGLCSTYFAKKRGMALGIVTSGNSAGGIVYPIVVRQLLPKIGFAWTVRVLGFVNVVSLGVVIAFMRPRLGPRKTGPLIDMDAFRDVPYILWVFGMCFLMAPVYFVFYYIASFGRDVVGLSYPSSLNLVMLLNGIGIPARIIPGYIADRYLGVLNTVFLCLLVNIIMLYVWIAVTDIISFYVFTAIYGLAAAAFQSLFPTSIAALSNDITKTGTRLGMAFSIISFAALVGGPISGALLAAGGGHFLAPQAWAATSTVVGTVFILAARAWKHGFSWRTRC